MQSPTSLAPARPTADLSCICRRIEAAALKTPEDRERDIQALGTLWQAAYGRWVESGNPVDRDEAVLLLHMQNEAIRKRPGAPQ